MIDYREITIQNPVIKRDGTIRKRNYHFKQNDDLTQIDGNYVKGTLCEETFNVKKTIWKRTKKGTL